MPRRSLRRARLLIKRQAELEAEIRRTLLAAWRSGFTIRQIAEAVGFSRARTHRLIQDAIAEEAAESRERARREGPQTRYDPHDVCLMLTAWYGVSGWA